MYTVIRDFSDSTDNKRVYRVGDVFPHPESVVSEDRIKGLLGTNNKQGVPLIKECVSEVKEDVREQRTDVDRGVKPEAKKRAKRGQGRNA